MDLGYVTCGMQLIETVPKALEKKKLKSKHKTIYEAWTELIDGTKQGILFINNNIKLIFNINFTLALYKSQFISSR